MDEENKKKKKKRGESLDVDGAGFDCDSYLSSLLQRKGLDQLVQVEHDMIHEVRRLDSEMQQLVYENYNKFLTATSTVKRMQSQFGALDKEMNGLTDSLDKMLSLSTSLGKALDGSSVTHLADTQRTLSSLHFIFGLPHKMMVLVERKDYNAAVRTFLEAKPVLDRFDDVPSICAVRDEAVSLMEDVCEQLDRRLDSRIISEDDIRQAVTLLLQLGRSGQSLSTRLLNNARIQLENDIDLLDRQDHIVDVLEFVDSGCSSFVTNLNLFLTLHRLLFQRFSMKGEEGPLLQLVDDVMRRFFAVAERRFLDETGSIDCSVLVRALDHFFRRVSAASELLPGGDHTTMSVALIMKVVRNEIVRAKRRILGAVESAIKQAMEQPAARIATSELGTAASRVENCLLTELKTALANQLLFTACDVTGAFLEPAVFTERFGIEVHERLVVAVFTEVAQLGEEFAEGPAEKAYVNCAFVLSLAQLFRQIEASSAGYILDLCVEQFRLVNEREKGSRLTRSSIVRDRLMGTANILLKHYVRMEGFVVAQLLVKSMEARDWLTCAEPRSVRAVMRRLLEDLNVIDARLGILLGESDKKERTPEPIRMSSRRPGDASSMSSTVDKLWTERVDYFANIEFKRPSILSPIVAVGLRSLLESVRLQVFGRFGVQQVQVDCCYLQMHLWRFVQDESLVCALLDEIVSSAVQRCIEPEVMDPGAVRAICERAASL